MKPAQRGPAGFNINEVDAVTAAAAAELRPSTGLDVVQVLVGVLLQLLPNGDQSRSVSS